MEFIIKKSSILYDSILPIWIYFIKYNFPPQETGYFLM